MAYQMSEHALELVDEVIRNVFVPDMRRAHPFEILEAVRERGGWFDIRPWCPVCGKSLAFDPAEAVRPHRWRHATCGSFTRHRWLIGTRKMRLLGP